MKRIFLLLITLAVAAPLAFANENVVVINPDGKPLPVKAVGATSANVDSTQTAATGTNWTALTSHASKIVTILNTTGVTIDVRYGTGTAVSVNDGIGFPFEGLTNASGLQIRRHDTSNTQATVTFIYSN
jgi:hypothetical protein